jgi:xylulokinase
VILTIDLGTTSTKAALWDGTGMVAIGRSRLATEHRAPGWAEQEAGAWWESVISAVSGLPALGEVSAVGFTGARQTFVPVTAAGDPIGRAILWSDTRRLSGGGSEAGSEGRSEAGSEGRSEAGSEGRSEAGSDGRSDAGSVVAKLRWLEAHEPGRLDAAAWVLAPRDLVAWRATGVVQTDWTLASASGLYAADGSLAAAAAPFASLLPSPVAPATVLGGLVPAAAGQLGLAAGTPVVIGAGDRQCEVLGTGASPSQPMVSWGTTANISAPLVGAIEGAAEGLRVRRGAPDGWIVEGGVSAAGSLMDWVSRLTGTDVESLLADAGLSPVGASGLVVLPWLGGARAPWWREDVGAAMFSLGPEHSRGDLGRAAVEGVALEIGRCLRLLGHLGGDPSALVLAGGGAESPLWVDVLGGVTGLPVVRRRWAEAASVGAALLTSSATSAALELDAVNPVVDERSPDPGAVAAYAGVWERSDRLAELVMGEAP